jgi:site-specific recombinase XerD
MNRFESFLAQQFEDYMTYRHQLGYDTKNLRWALKTVDRYLVTQNAAAGDLTPAFFLGLRGDLHTQNKSINRLLCCTRKFFEYLVRKEYCRDNPLRDIPWLPEERFIPFIFSPPQIDKLLAAVCGRLRNSRKHFVKDLGSYLAILLLARCGTRIYEPLRLRRDHFRADDNTLYPEFAGLIIHGQHIFHRHIGHDAVVRAANVAAVFAQHPDALTDFPADIVGGSKRQGCLGGNPAEKSDVVTIFTL